MNPEELEARILYRDGLVIIIDKPAGVPVHAGPGGGANLEQGFDALRFGLPKAPSLAHRLDRDTSGCLILGRHPKALRRLGRMFMGGLVEKTYWAVVKGGPAEDQGRIDLALAKQNAQWGWHMVADPEGQASVTDYVVRGRSDHLSWLELYPRTGRTHQIRVHCAALGCPVLGDPIYGKDIAPDPAFRDVPLQLHARRIALPLYASRPIEATAPVPAHMRAALGACGWVEPSIFPLEHPV